MDVDTAFEQAQELTKEGKIAEAGALCRRIIDVVPHHARAWHLAGFANLYEGQPGEALRKLTRSEELGNDNPLMFMHLGIARAAENDLPGSVAALRSAVEGEPGLAPAHFNLALSQKRLGQLAEAEAALRKAVHYAPGYADAWCELGAVQMAQQSGADDVLASLDHALSANPDHVGALNLKAVVLHAQGRTCEAEGLLKRAIALAPDRPELHVNFGDMMLDRDGEAAIQAYRRALDIAPDFPDATARLAAALQRLRQLDEARKLAETALSQNPASWLAQITLARCDVQDGEPEAALTRLDNLEPAQVGENEAFVWGKLRASVLERLGRYPEAFAAAVQANANRLDRDPPDADLVAASYDQLASCRAWITPELVATWSDAPAHPQDTPVFFVGFPRSGTTLMEHILKAHPDFTAAGENEWLRYCTERLPATYPEVLDTLDEAALEKLRQSYWQMARERLGPTLDGKRLVDKMPLNILYLGLVRRMFPNAKVLVALRDPRDCVLSGFMQVFTRTTWMDQFLSLESAVRFYGAVMDLWAHERDVLGLDTLEYRYEDLTANPRVEMQRILGFLGAPWDEAVLAHHTAMSPTETIATPSMHDVRAPMHTRAQARWRNYADELAPVMDALAPFVRALGYDEA